MDILTEQKNRFLTPLDFSHFRGYWQIASTKLSMHLKRYGHNGVVDTTDNRTTASVDRALCHLSTSTNDCAPSWMIRE